MNNKDIFNLYNIYQNILKESQIEPNLSQTIQLESTINEKRLNSKTTIENEEKIKNKKIFEGFIGGFLKGIDMAKKGEFSKFSTKKDKDKKKKNNYQKPLKKKTPLKKKGNYGNPNVSGNANTNSVNNKNVTP